MPLSDAALAKLIIENVRSHGIIGLTADGCITAWAAGAEAITGYTREDVLGMDFAELFTPADRAASMPQAELQTALRDGRAEDSRWHQRKDGSLFWGNGVTVDLGTGGLLAKIFRDETAAKRAEEQRVLLLNELNHRVKNTLATVQAIAAQTLRTNPEPAAFRAAFESRLVALSATHDLLTATNWRGAALRDVAQIEFRPYGPERYSLDGPEVALAPTEALSLGLLFHELATNAAKYGALSGPEGCVEVTWTVADGRLALSWRERGGPKVIPPTRRGFGSRLIERSLKGEMGGEAVLDFAEDGLVCRVTLPLSGES